MMWVFRESALYTHQGGFHAAAFNPRAGGIGVSFVLEGAQANLVDGAARLLALVDAGTQAQHGKARFLAICAIGVAEGSYGNSNKISVSKIWESSDFSCLYRYKIQNEKEIHIHGILGTQSALNMHFVNHVGNYVKLHNKSFEMRLKLEKTEFNAHTLLLVNILDVYEDLNVNIAAEKSVIKQDDRMIFSNLEEVITLILRHFLKT